MDNETTALRLLESLTPSGSEFVNNPQACYEYVRDLIKSQHDRIILVTKQRNEAQQKWNNYFKSDWCNK